MGPSRAEERRVVEAAKAGSHEALGELIDLWKPLVEKIVFAFSATEVDGEDLAQEAAIDLLDGLKTFEVGRPLRPWIATVARNAALRHRVRVIEREVATTPIEEEPPDPRTIPGDLGGRLTLEQALSVLSRLDREIVRLHVLGGFRFREIGELLEIPTSTASFRWRKASKRLRRELPRWE